MSKPKVPKEPLTPLNLRRYLEDLERKGDRRPEATKRSTTRAITYAESVIAGTASDLELEEFWRQLYAVFVEIEAYHRRLDSDARSDAGLNATSLGKFVGRRAQHTVRAHDCLRSVVTIDDLVLIHLRRHAACHVSVDGNQIRLVNGTAMVERSPFQILGGALLSVEDQDAHAAKARTAKEIAAACLPFLQSLLFFAAPLHTAQKGAREIRFHVVQDPGTNLRKIAEGNSIDLDALLKINEDDDGVPSADASLNPGTFVSIP